MKTNEAPINIYLQVCGDCQDNDCDNCKFEDLEDNVTWCKDKIFEKDVEYIRTDAFIEKACSWLKSKGGFTIGFDGAEIKDFKNYMQNESR